MRFTKVRPDTFKKLVMNAGIICADFSPETGVVSDIIGATTGDLSFASNPEYVDFGEDVNNVPANTKQLKRLKSVDPTLSGSYVSVDAAIVKSMIGSATEEGGHIVPKGLDISDFKNIWLVADYSDNNSDASGGYVAIHIKNALNTAGFQLTTTKDGKGNVSFEYHGHYDLDELEEDSEAQPYEIYIKDGAA